MVLQVWRHRPSGSHFVVDVENGRVLAAKGPMTPQQTLALTQAGFEQDESDPALATVLNATAAQFEPIWEADRSDYSYEEWLAREVESGELD